VGGHMSVSKFAAGSLALAIGAAVVTALAANPEGKPEAASAPGPEAKAALVTPAATKSDRLAVRPKPAARPVTSACPQEPWPYGCQWRSPTRKVMRGSRPS
jgi:hypothetical protein